MVSHGVTHASMSPAQVHTLVDQFAIHDNHCPNLVCLRIGGGPLSPGLLEKARSTLTPNVFVIYGATESGVLSYATPEMLEFQPSSVGKLLSGVEIEVVDEDNKPQRSGELGFLRSRYEDQVTQYHLDDERSRKHFRDGWFYSGDMGRIDSDGFLYIEGRADEQLNIGGLNINP